MAARVSCSPMPRLRARGSTPSAPIQPVAPKLAQHAPPTIRRPAQATRISASGESRG
jgi:hypothetical protein